MTSAVDDDVFIVTWQRSKSLGEAARALGYVDSERGRNCCSMRACRLRAIGVALKRFDARKKNIERLKWLADRAAKDAAVEGVGE